MPDNSIFISRLNHIEKLTKISIKSVQADRAYGGAYTLKTLYMQGITPYIPFFHSKGGFVKGIELGFVYEKKNDRYVCPTGNYLYPYDRGTNNYRRYRAKAKECYMCPIKDSCLNTKLKTLRPKWINRNVEQEVLDKHLKNTKKKEFKKKLQERMWKSEGIMSQLKFYHGLNRARFRSLIKVQMQGWLAAITVNLKRLAKVLIFKPV